MKPLSVLHVHLGRRDGGAERQSASLLAGLAEAGHRVLGIVGRGTPAERDALAAGAPIFPLGPRFPLGPGGLITWWSRGRARLLARKGRWDVVHFADPRSLAAGRAIFPGAGGDGAIPSRRVLVTWRGHAVARGAGASRRGAIALLKRHQRAGGTIAAASEALWAALVRDGFEEERLAVIHPGIDVKAFGAVEAEGSAARGRAREAARRDLGVPASAELVGTVAVLDADRGIPDLIDATAFLARDRPAARLVVVGDGPHRPSLEARAERAGVRDRVLFAGRRQEIRGILASLDAYVFTGQGEEGFPLSLVEAMAAGAPVVARDQPGIREIIENGKQGLLVPGNEPASLARTIGRLLSEATVSRGMGRAGAVRVQRFHTQAMVDATENLYYRLVSAKEGA